MTAYLQFKSGNGVVLLEVDEVYPSSGEQEAGLGQRARDHVADAMIATRSGFEDAECGTRFTLARSSPG